MKFFPLGISVAVGLAGCVAPEQPPPKHIAVSATRPVPSGAAFEDAPLPNRKVGGPTNDSIIRMAR